MRALSTRVVVTTWLGMLGTGLGMLIHHGNVAGAVGRVATTLTAGLAEHLAWNTTRPLLVLCAHPQCPCLESTLGELQRAVAGRSLDLCIVTFVPTVPPASWDPAAVDALRRDLPEARHLPDHDGALATRLGAATSGHVLLYDTTGALRFSGGVTGGRGHRGDNAAVRTLAQVLGELGRSGADSATTAVFGCPLRADEEPRHGTSCCKPD